MGVVEDERPGERKQVRQGATMAIRGCEGRTQRERMNGLFSLCQAVDTAVVAVVIRICEEAGMSRLDERTAGGFGWTAEVANL